MIRTWAKETQRHFTNEDIQMINKHMKRCATLTAMREMQIKTQCGPGQVAQLVGASSRTQKD